MRHVWRVKMKTDEAKWDYELLAVLSMYAGTSIGKLKNIICALAEELEIKLPVNS
jgi:hypothetical protein